MRLDTLKEISLVAGREYMLRQLAEEASELCQAALKLIRAENHETPVTVEDARHKLIEEFADLNIMLEWLDYCELNHDEVMEAHRIESAKGERFARRVLGGGDGEPGWRE